MACAIFLPYGILAKAAFSRAWAQPLTWSNLTLGNFTFTFFEYSATQVGHRQHARARRSMTATIGAVPGRAAGLRRQPAARSSATRLVAFLALAPIVIPGVVLAVGLFIAYTRPPLRPLRHAVRSCSSPT